MLTSGEPGHDTAAEVTLEAASGQTYVRDRERSTRIFPHARNRLTRLRVGRASRQSRLPPPSLLHTVGSGTVGSAVLARRGSGFPQQYYR